MHHWNPRLDDSRHDNLKLALGTRCGCLVDRRSEHDFSDGVTGGGTALIPAPASHNWGRSYEQRVSRGASITYHSNLDSAESVCHGDFSGLIWMKDLDAQR